MTPSAPPQYASLYALFFVILSVVSVWFYCDELPPCAPSSVITPPEVEFDLATSNGCGALFTSWEPCHWQVDGTRFELEDCRFDSTSDCRLPDITKDTELVFRNVVFVDDVDLSEREFAHFTAERCTFLKGLKLDEAEVKTGVVVTRSEVGGSTSMVRLRTQFVDLEETSFYGSTDLSDAEIKGELAARNARFKGSRPESGGSYGRLSLSIEKASAARMDFSGAYVAQNLIAAHAVAEKGAALFEDARIGGVADFDFFQTKTEQLFDRAHGREITLHHATGERFSFQGSRFGRVIADDATPKRLDLRDAKAALFSLERLKSDYVQLTSASGELRTRGLQSTLLVHDEDWEGALRVLCAGGADAPTLGIVETSLRDRGRLRDANRVRHVRRRKAQQDSTGSAADLFYGGVGDPFLYGTWMLALVSFVAALLARRDWTVLNKANKSAPFGPIDPLLHAIAIVLPGDITGYLKRYAAPSGSSQAVVLMAFQAVGLFLTGLLLISIAALVPK